MHREDGKMFGIEDYILGNVFQFTGAFESPTPIEEDDVAEKERKQRAKKTVNLDKVSVDEASDWLRFMEDKGFMNPAVRMDEDGKLISALGDKDGRQHEVTPAIRNIMEG